jgi:tripartite-type tricarboxylate transporter receptor subunit TctC
MHLISRRAFAVGAMLAAAAALSPVSAQQWPSRFITLVVPFPAGGPTDLIARALAAAMQEKLGQQIVIENRSGAGGNVGAASVAKAAPDGYTLLLATTFVVNNRFMYRNLPYDTDRDFAPIALISKTPIIIVAKAALGVKNLVDLVAMAKANPGKLNFGSPGHGTSAHITFELLQTQAGIKLTHVPYRGSTPMIADLLGNQIDVVTDLLPTQAPLVSAGKFPGLVVTSAARSDRLPDVPTMQESGFPGFEASSWNGLVAPTGTPPDIVAKLNTLVNDYLKSDKSKQDLAKFAMQPGGGSPADFKAFMAGEVDKWGPIIKAANIMVQ